MSCNFIFKNVAMQNMLPCKIFNVAMQMFLNVAMQNCHETNFSVSMPTDLAPPHPTPCSKAFLYCGITNNFYPDSRPMGFPFDRPIGSLDGCGGGVWGKICKLFSGGGSGRRIRFVEEFLGGVGNAGVVPVVVRNGKKK